jgi:hypothetical protein
VEHAENVNTLAALSLVMMKHGGQAFDVPQAFVERSIVVAAASATETQPGFDV